MCVYVDIQTDIGVHRCTGQQENRSQGRENLLGTRPRGHSHGTGRTRSLSSSRSGGHASSWVGSRTWDAQLLHPPWSRWRGGIETIWGLAQSLRVRLQRSAPRLGWGSGRAGAGPSVQHTPCFLWESSQAWDSLPQHPGTGGAGEAGET